MADTHVNIETQLRIRETVLDSISKIDPYGDRPVMTSIGRKDIEGTKPEWTKQALDVPTATNKQTHGFTITFAAADWKDRTQDSNYTQLMNKKVAVNLSHEATSVAGIPKGGELDEQKTLKYDALLNDVEAMLISGNARVQPLPGATAQSGQSGGIQTFVVTNAIVAGSTNYPSKTLMPAYYHTLAQKCKKQGGKPNKSFCGIGAKEAIAGWITQVNRPVSDQGRKLVNVINQYETVSGMQDIVLHMQLTSVLLMIETGRFDTGWLREPKWFPYPANGDFHGGDYRLEATLISWAEEASGKITGLSYTA